MKRFSIIVIAFATASFAASAARAEEISLYCKGNYVIWNLWIDTANATVVMQEAINNPPTGQPIGPFKASISPNFFIWSPGFNRRYTIDRSTGAMTYVDPNTNPPLQDSGTCQKMATPASGTKF